MGEPQCFGKNYKLLTIMSGLADNPSWEGERGAMTKPRYESSTLSNVKNLVGAEKASSVIRKLWPNLFLISQQVAQWPNGWE